MLTSIIAAISLTQVQPLGHVYQGREPFEMHEKPDTSSKVLSRGTKGQHVAGKPDKNPEFIRVLLVNGTYGYALASRLIRTEKQFVLPSDSRASAEQIGTSGAFYLKDERELKQIVGRYVDQELISMASRLTKEEFALLGMKSDLTIRSNKTFTLRINKNSWTGKLAYNRQNRTVMIKPDRINGRKDNVSGVIIFRLGIKGDKLALVWTADDRETVMIRK